MKRSISILLLCLLLLGAVACALPDGGNANEKDPPSEETQEPWEDFNDFENYDEGIKYSYFPSLERIQKVYSVKYDFKGLKPYAFSMDKHNEMLTLSALQGLIVRNKGTEGIYLNVISESGTEPGSSQFWLDQLEESYDISVQETESDSALEFLVNKFSGNITKTKNGKPGYILYRQEMRDTVTPEGTTAKKGSPSVNAAFTACSATGYLPVDETFASKFDGMGFEQALDVRDWSEEDAYDQFKDDLSDKLINLSPNDTVNSRDYGVATSQFFMDECYAQQAFREKMSRKYKNNGNTVIMGWGSYNEVEQIRIDGSLGYSFLCTVYNYNLTVFASLGKKVYRQRNAETDIKADPGKHYVTFIMSDGDNISWHENNFSFSEKLYGFSVNKELRAQFPFKMGWTISPAMVDLAPNIMGYEYQKASPYDYFVAGTSGANICYPSTFTTKETLENVAAATGEYMRRAGLQYTEILNDTMDSDKSGMPFDDTVMNAYAEQEEIHGAFVLKNDNKYIEGGTIKWYNGKPFVGVSDSLWQESPKRLAHRLNSLPADIDSANGYSVIKVHCWSISMQEVALLVNSLDEHIAVVSPGELMQLIQDNVPKSTQQRTVLPDTDYPSDVDEPYDLKAVYESTSVNENSRFDFDEYLDYCGFQKWIGYKEYDYVSFSGEAWKYNVDGGGKQSADGGDGYSIRFDGSDYNVPDEQPNAAIYSKFTLSGKTTLSLKAKSAYEPYHAYLRVRVISKGANGYSIETIESEQTQAQSSFIMVDGQFREYRFDLSAYAGQTVVIFIEYNVVSRTEYGGGPMYIDEICFL